MTAHTAYFASLHRAWRDEQRSALYYRRLAEREAHPDRKAILVRMAEAEERHAASWAERLRAAGHDPGTYRPTLLERARGWVLLRSDAAAAARMLEDGESQADALYDRLLTLAPTEDVRKEILDAQREERVHTRLLQEGEQPPQHASGRLDAILGRERWHVRAGGWIGQAIYGVNDGLGAAFGVVSGVAGATGANGEFVLLSGFAAAIASALSMGSGAYLAMKSEREVYEAELERERGEIESHPEEEREELELFYQLKGLSAEEAGAMVARLAERPDQFLRALAHEELGLSRETFPNEWRAALSATVSTAIGALVPVLPFLFVAGVNGLLLSLVVSTVAHFLVGASKVVVTGRSWMKSGIEMTLVGLGEAAITYGIGLLVAPILG
jgi:VIT1/CCC1 family predicted Fe2+/Mn2+ transporter/rubrerythrin